MWAAAVIVSALVGVALVSWSVTLGFTFFVLPILFCELVLLGGPQAPPLEYVGCI